MRITDWLVWTLVVVTFVGLLLSPSKWDSRLVLACFAVVGSWAMLYPQGVLGWAKTAHRSINADDSSIYWVPRFIGCCFVLGVLLITFVGAWR
jgi:hypothetical protein